MTDLGRDTEDIKLCYFGGSGGFLLLHLLLLSDQFACKFVVNKQTENLSIDKIIERQWNITNPRHWKSLEVWPDNRATLNSDIQRKIYLFCFSAERLPKFWGVDQFSGKQLFLYTDAASHRALAAYKRAYPFIDGLARYPSFVSYYRYHLQLWRKHYADIRDASWPDICTGPNGFRNLPEHCRRELLSNPFTVQSLTFPKVDKINKEHQDRLLNSWHVEDQGILPDGTIVAAHVAEAFNESDMQIRLSDLLQNLNILESITGVPINQRQISLSDKWISLHPPEILQKLNISSEKISSPRSSAGRALDL